MSTSSSSPDDLWDALEGMQLRLSSFQSPSGKPSVGDPGGLVKGSSSAPMDDSKPAAESVLVSLVYVKDGAGKDVCGGRVGADRVKFCTAECAPGSSSCGKVASHVKKEQVSTHAYYISVPSHRHAFVQPVLVAPPSGFPDFVLDVLASPRSVSAWMEIFTAFKDIHLLDTEDQLNIVLRFNSQVDFSLQCGPTPMKFKKRRVDVGGMGMEGHDEATTGSWVIDTPDEPSVLPTNENFEVRIMHIVNSWDKVILMGQHQRQLALDFQSDIKSYLETVDNKVVKMSSMLGERPSEGAPGLSIWSSISAQGERLMVGQDAFDKFRSSTDEALRSFDVEVKDIRGVIGKQLVPAITNIADRVSTQSISNESVSELAQTQVNKMIENFRAELRSLLPNGGLGINGNEELTLMRQELAALKDEIVFLKEENQRLQAESNVDTIEFGGYIFNSPSSYVTWVTTNLPSAYMGFCFDFISLLECYSNQNRIAEDGLKMAESIKKAGYKDKQVAIIDQSFGCTFPKVFGDEQDSTNPAKKMGKLKTRVEWDNPTANTGLKIRINTFITAFRKMIDTQVNKRFSYGTPASLFFTTLMQHNVKFWECLSSWITRFERELTHRSGGDNVKMHEENSWNLICWMIHSMFIEMNVRRAPGSGLSIDDDDADSKIEKCAAVLHGTLAAHKFMAELITAEFVRHPIFASTMDEFLLTNKAAHVAVVNLEAKCKKLEERVNGIQATADRAMQEVKNANKGKGQAQK